MSTTWKEILEKQEALRDKFEAIEAGHNLLEWRGPITDINSPLQQMKLRRRCWEIVEEIGESLDVMWCGGDAREEIADAFHFLMELCTLFPDRIEGAEATVEAAFEWESANVRDVHEPWTQFIASIARLANLLKNRPHKRHDQYRKTDPQLFDDRLTNAVFAFVRACVATGVTAEDLVSSYHAKAAINEQRIES